MVAGLGPVGDDVVDYDVADAVGAVEGGKVGAVLADFGFGEALGCGGTGTLLVEVGSGAENEDAVDVHLFCFGEPGEGLQGAGVFHAADDVGAVAVGLVFDPVASPLVEELAVPEGGGGEVVAAEDEGWVVGGFFGVLHATGGDGGVSGSGRVFGEGEGPVDEGRVEVVDVAVVAEARGAGLLVGRGFAEGDVAGLPVGWDLAGVDLVGEVAVDDVVGPDGGGRGSPCGGRCRRCRRRGSRRG